MPDSDSRPPASGAPPANLRFRLYAGGRSAVQAARRLLPSALLPPQRDLSSAFAIGITTYSQRYDLYFRSLHQRLTTIFPEVSLVVAVNGHGTPEQQAAYLERFEREICAGAPPHQRFILHDRVYGLTTLWNALLAAAPAGLPLLLLNDDLCVDGFLRRWAEAFNWSQAELTLLNASWSHFVIAPSVVSRVGAFDPAFPGIGFEDMDYTARAGLAGVPIGNHLCAYLRHQDHKPDTTSFDERSERVWGKYTSANQAHFAAQWEPCPVGEGVWIKQLRSPVRPRRPLRAEPLPPIDPAAWCGGVLHPDRLA